MRRRNFVKTLTALAAAPSTAALGASTFSEAPLEHPWSMGFEGVTGDLEALPMTVQGRIPDACLGTVYRNGPALYERGQQRYQHWFDPDGMVQSYHLSKSGITHRGRFVRTPRHKEESLAGRFLYGGAGTEFLDQWPVRNNETTNVANINVQPFGGELLALWEAGSAYRIDPQSLETHGPMDWSEELKGAPFSAHPRVDDHGDLWNIGSLSFSHRPALVLFHIAANGKLVKSAIQPLDFGGYMHDFVLTPRYLIALNSSAVMGDGRTFVDRMQWQGDRPSQLLVFDRNDFRLLKTLEVPATFVFHFGNAWESSSQIHFTACAHADNQIVATGMRRLAQQQSGPYHTGAHLQRYDLDLASNRCVIEALEVNMEFPGFDKRAPFQAQSLFGVSGHQGSESGLASQVLRVDPKSGDTNRFDSVKGIVVEEPLFVPSSDGGFIVHSFLDYRRRQSGLAILAAEHLSDGPIALAHMERVVPLGFHGCFLGTSQRA